MKGKYPLYADNLYINARYYKDDKQPRLALYEIHDKIRDGKALNKSRKRNELTHRYDKQQKEYHSVILWQQYILRRYYSPLHHVKQWDFLSVIRSMKTDYNTAYIKEHVNADNEKNDKDTYPAHRIG